MTLSTRIGRPQLLVAALCVCLPLPASAQVLNLAWDPSPTAGLDYHVHVGTTAGSDNVLDQWVPGSQTTYAFPATPGVRYYFAVSSVDANGTESAWSTTISGGIATFAQPGNQTGVVGTAISPLNMTVVDPDSGTLTFTATGLPSGLTINGTTGRITGTPAAAGSHTVTVSVSDGQFALARAFTWTISAGSATVVSAVSASPSSGAGAVQSFALAYSASTGAADLSSVQVTFGSAPGSAANACAISYNPAGGLVSLLNDAGASWQSASIGSGVLQNSQCEVALAGSSATVSDTRLTLNLAIRFAASWSGTKNTYLYAASASGPTSGWVNRGSWAVPSATLAIASDVASPKATGATITFTGTVNGSTSGHQYKWWLFDGTTWTVVRDWGGATFAWTPARADDNYRVGMWARVAGSTANSSALNVSVPFAITSNGSPAPAPSAPSTPATPLVVTGITTNLPSPQVTGTAVTFTAAGSGGTAPYEYKWWLFDGSGWVITQNWSTTATFRWTPAQAGTAYRIGVWMRSAGDTRDVSTANLSASFAITSNGSPAPAPAPSAPATPLVVTGITSNLPSPQVTGAAVTFTAAGSGGTAPYEYKWWVSNGSGWVITQNWSTTATFRWTPAQAGTAYRIAVWMRSAGDTRDVSTANLSVPFAITATGAAPAAPGGALRITGLSGNVGSPRVGTPVTFTAAATGGVGPYQYKWWVFDGTTWSIRQTWGSGTFTWTPTADGSTYRVGIWVRDSTTSADTSAVNLSIAVPVAQ